MKRWHPAQNLKGKQFQLFQILLKNELRTVQGDKNLKKWMNKN